MTGYHLFNAMQQLTFEGLTGTVQFDFQSRLNPLINFYQLNDDGTYHIIGNFTNTTITIDNSTLDFATAGIPISGI